MNSMQVQCPPGAKAGQVIQVVSPEGLTIQAQIPPGVKPGKPFAVQYPVTSTPAIVGQSTKNYSTKRVRDIIVMICLIILAVWLTNTFGKGAHEVEHQLLSHWIIISALCLGFAYDVHTLGPSVALQNCAVAGVLSWLFVIPIAHFLATTSWFVICMLAACSLFLGLCGGCIGAAGAGPLGFFCGLLAFFAILWFFTLLASFLKGTIGDILVFLFTFAAMRLLFSMTTGLQDVGAWPYITEIDKQSEEYRQQLDYFTASCLPWEHKYSFDLHIKRIYRVERPDSVPTVSGSSKDGDAGLRQLFHGTGWESAKAICCDGFRLPSHAGMFGRGLYFADCPLKSWRYCFPTKQIAKLIPATTGRGGLIFMCWVELGKVLEKKEADAELTGSERRGFKAWLFGQSRAYDSVKGVEEEEGGALRVPEYVVYRPEQVHVSYLFEVIPGSRDVIFIPPR